MEAAPKENNQGDGFLNESIDRDAFIEGLQKIQSQESPQKDFSITFEPKDGVPDRATYSDNTSHENELNKAVLIDQDVSMPITVEQEEVIPDPGNSPPRIIEIEEEDNKPGKFVVVEEVKKIEREEAKEFRPNQKHEQKKVEECVVDEPQGVTAKCFEACALL